ncbi:dual specificity protein phosphatase family protein [Maribacter sp. ANRC-HE7]|uniref:Dual specificity protein phosphatase family protein n=1 Tax=Maribacter aquimaris TaxID=2737171 RepID=A0ABR7V385_9FLAO|nr:dual specificity protein phosphatase [Maribacter aquimaris]MBD0777632.1 dual specificity protein phosphatase family protein [Maribacter aquimaris]
MKEIDRNLYVGSLNDYKEFQNESDFSFVQACKEPCHRKAVGYTGRSVAKTHPEYLLAYRPNRLILNMVDTPTGKYFDKILFDKSIEFIESNLNLNKKVLIHCNQGVSRSPSIGLLYMALKEKISNYSFITAKDDFSKIYPEYKPSGIQEFLIENWNYFKNK